MSGLLRPRRQVFATASGGSEGGGVTPESVTLDNLGDQLMALEGNKLNVQQVTRAMQIVNGTDEAAKKKLLTLTKNLLAGTYDAAAFEARLPKAGTATTTTTAAPATPEAVAGAPTTPEAAAIDTEVKEVSNWTSDQIKNLMNTLQATKQQVENDNAISDEQLKQNLDRVMKDTVTLNEVDKQNTAELKKRLKAVLDGLPADIKLSEKEEERLLKIDPQSRDFDARFEKATSKLKDHAQGKLARESMLQNLKEHAEKDKQVEADLRKRLREFSDVMNTIRNDLNTEGARMAAIKSYSRMAGIPLSRDHKLTYREASADGLTFTRQNAIIKDVRFAGVEPVIDVEFKNPNTGELIVVPMSPASFNEWIEALNVTSDIETLDDLEKAIDLKISEGDLLEYDVIKEGGLANFETDNHQIKIEKIDKIAKTIDLDKPVKLSGSGQETKTVTFGEFSKWFLKNEVVPTLPSLEKLREELNGFNEALNSVNKRDSSTHPSIEAKPGEVLKYEDGSDSTFMIAEADDQHIVLSHGDKFTLAGFMRWVRKNKVIKDPEETKKAKEAKEKHDEAVAKGEEPANENAEHDPHAHSDPHASKDPSVDAIKFLWYKTRILSPHSIKEWGTAIYEFAKRKLNRKEHERVGYIGEKIFKNVPWFGTELGAEFKSMAQHAENEEVNHHIDHMKTMGANVIKHELHDAPNPDILKASISVAAEKGSLRWDDPGLWEAFNRFTYGELKDPKTKGPLWVKEENHMYAMEKYLDHWFGDDTFREFRQKADGSYNSIKNNFKDAAARLETDPERNGGLSGKLKQLMFKHIKGEYVNAAEFEQYLEFAITAGKLTFEDKLFFMIMGLGAQAYDPHGHGLTLLHEDRMGAFSNFTNTFPIIDFFTKGGWPQFDAHGHPIMEVDNPKKQKTGRINPHHFKTWIAQYVLADCGVTSLDEITSPDQLKPRANFNRFLLEDIASDEATKVRLEKASSDATRWDHDDMHVFGPMLSETGVEQILSRQGGARMTVSLPGLKNAYTGFNNFMFTKMGMLQKHSQAGNQEAVQMDQRGIGNLIKTFMRFDAILENRFQHDSASYSRMSQQDYDGMAGADDGVNPVRMYAQELRTMVMKLSEKLDQETSGRFDLVNQWRLVLDKRAVDKKAQVDAVKNFGEYMDGALAEVAKNGQDKVTKILLDVSPVVTGVPWEAKPKTKTEEEKTSAEMFEFKPYVNQVVISKVNQIGRLTNELQAEKLKTPAQIKAEQAYRLGEIINEVEAEKYVGGTDDVEILDKEIRRLENELTKSKAA